MIIGVVINKDIVQFEQDQEIIEKYNPNVANQTLSCFISYDYKSINAIRTDIFSQIRTNAMILTGLRYLKQLTNIPDNTKYFEISQHNHHIINYSVIDVYNRYKQEINHWNHLWEAWILTPQGKLYPISFTHYDEGVLHPEIYHIQYTNNLDKAQIEDEMIFNGAVKFRYTPTYPAENTLDVVYSSKKWDLKKILFLFNDKVNTIPVDYKLYAYDLLTGNTVSVSNVVDFLFENKMEV